MHRSHGRTATAGRASDEVLERRVLRGSEKAWSSSVSRSSIDSGRGSWQMLVSV